MSHVEQEGCDPAVRNEEIHMKVASKLGRAVVVSDDGSRSIDVEKASAGAFGPTTQDVFEDWAAFVGWSSQAQLDYAGAGEDVDLTELDAPSPAAVQTFAIGLNYRDHADESGFSYPETPPTFTKFRSSFAGPVTTLVLPNDTVDWEAELVVVIGRTATNVAAADAWDYIAGLTVGQDYSERTLQLSGPAPQFSLGKSFAGFAPQGPWLVTLDEISDPANLAISCTINGETVQNGRTDQLIFTIPELIERLSKVTTLSPGDVIFTGTPSGVGGARNPKWFLKDGDVVETTIEGLGTLRQTCVAAAVGADA